MKFHSELLLAHCFRLPTKWRSKSSMAEHTKALAIQLANFVALAARKTEEVRVGSDEGVCFLDRCCFGFSIVSKKKFESMHARTLASYCSIYLDLHAAASSFLPLARHRFTKRVQVEYTYSFWVTPSFTRPSASPLAHRRCFS
jgi:hypothetical protein